MFGTPHHHHHHHHHHGFSYGDALSKMCQTAVNGHWVGLAATAAAAAKLATA
jgi:hypothetical protein